MINRVDEFHYQVAWRSRSAIPGHRISSQTGGEQEFHGHAPLIQRPEPHNLDIHASLLDPFQQYVVRTFRQRSIISINLLADLSASMAMHDKMQTLAEFTGIAAYSAYRSGDYFGFFGCAEQLVDTLYHPPRWYKGGLPELQQQLADYNPQGRNCLALQQAHEYLPHQRSLVFIISDFHFALPEITRVFDSLVKHDVVPIVLWHRREYAELPDWGVLRLQDAESGRDRQLLMRPRLKQKISQQYTIRRQQLSQLFLNYGRQGFFIEDNFQADRMTRYFYEQ